MNRQKKRRIDRNASAEKTMLLLAFCVLRERFGFGEVRLTRFIEAMEAESETISETRLSDLAERLEDELHWKIEL